MHALPDKPTAPGRPIARAGPAAYVVPSRDGQPDYVVVIDGDTMIGNHELPTGYVVPSDADIALRRIGFSRTSGWHKRGSRGGHRCTVAPVDDPAR